LTFKSQPEVEEDVKRLWSRISAGGAEYEVMDEPTHHFEVVECGVAGAIAFRRQDRGRGHVHLHFV
jgi:hypothetical protein